MHLSIGHTSIKAILFDCDGTLVDSEYAHYLGFKLALQDIGHDLLVEDYHEYVGKGDLTVANLLALKIEKDCPGVIFHSKRMHYLKLCEVGLPPIEPTVTLLKALAQEKGRLGIKLGVCSAAKKEEVLFHLRHLGVENVLDVILSGEEDLEEYLDPEGVNKPKPYIYLHAMKKLGALPDECVVIEDSIPGITAARLAGCLTIAVPNSYTRNQDLSSAHLRIESFAHMDIDAFFQIIENKKAKLTPPINLGL